MRGVGPLHPMASWIILLPALFALGCADHPRLSDPEGDETAQFTLGPAHQYAIPPGGEAILQDSLTQCALRFPEGGTGTITVARILTGPAGPFAGNGFAIEYAGSEPIEVVVPGTAGDRPMVFGYGRVDGLFDDVTPGSERWIAVPEVDTLDQGIAFLLTMPFEGSALRGQEIPAGRAVAIGPSTARRGFSRYWFSSIPAGSNDATRMLHMELQASSYVDSFLAALAPARQTAVRAEVNGRMHRHYTFDGLYYDGFWWRSLGAHGRLIRPTIHLTLSANVGNIAHETGHYAVHTLVGDDAQSTLEGQQPLWNTEHGIGDAIGRERIADDYAFVLEWFFTGGIKSDDPLDPHVLFLNHSPLTDDFPGTEGFAAALLAALTRAQPSMKDLTTGRPTNVPAPALGFDRLFEIIARGATGVNDLRVEIERELGTQAELLPPIAQRTGWSYSVRGRFVNPSGDPVAGVVPSSFARVAGETYEGGWSQIPSGADGRFAVVGDVFPGDSWIRAVADGDTAEVAIQIDWNRPTDQSVELHDLVVSFPPSITSLSPDHGKAGDAVEIVGQRFGATQGSGAVSFNGTGAAITTWSEARITATVPAGARSGDVVVTVAGMASRGVPFTIEGGRWVLDHVENRDVAPRNGVRLNINEFTVTAGGLSIRSGYDNPFFTEVWFGDWETTVQATWTVPSAELIPGESLGMSLSVETEKIRMDDPATESAKSSGYIWVRAWGNDSETLMETASETYHFIVPGPAGTPPDSSWIAISVRAGGYVGGSFDGGYAGSVSRDHLYRFHSN